MDEKSNQFKLNITEEKRYFCLRQCKNCKYDFSQRDSYRGPRMCPNCGTWTICRNAASKTAHFISLSQLTKMQFFF